MRPAGDSLGWYNGTAFSAKGRDRSGSATCFDSKINRDGKYGGWWEVTWLKIINSYDFKFYLYNDLGLSSRPIILDALQQTSSVVISKAMKRMIEVKGTWESYGQASGGCNSPCPGCISRLDHFHLIILVRKNEWRSVALFLLKLTSSGAEFSDGFVSKISWFSLTNPSENSAPEHHEPHGRQSCLRDDSKHMAWP